MLTLILPRVFGHKKPPIRLAAWVIPMLWGIMPGIVGAGRAAESDNGTGGNGASLAVASGLAIWPEDFAEKPRPERREIGRIVHLNGPVIHRDLPPEASGLDVVAPPPPEARPFYPDEPVSTVESVTTGPGGHWEAVVGQNIRLLLGAEGELIVERSDSLPGDSRRLGLRLVRGMLRVRVARNTRRPEVVVLGANGLSVLLERGDLIFFADSAMPATETGDAASQGNKAAKQPDPAKAAPKVDGVLVLDGNALVKPVEHKAAGGGSFRLEAGEAMLAADGSAPARVRPETEAREAWRAGLAFLPERERAALPPAPPEGYGIGGL